MTTKNDKKAELRDPDTPLLEWICGALGLALFAGALAITGLNAVSPHAPASIVARAQPAEPAGGRFRVMFEAFNTGDEAAADVNFMATLRRGQTTIEMQEVSIDLLPAHSSKRAGVFFGQDPAGLSLEIVAVSFQET